MICSKCGAQLPDTAKLCETCGDVVARTAEHKVTAYFFLLPLIIATIGSVLLAFGYVGVNSTKSPQKVFELQDKIQVSAPGKYHLCYDYFTGTSNPSNYPKTPLAYTFTGQNGNTVISASLPESQQISLSYYKYAAGITKQWTLKSFATVRFVEPGEYTVTISGISDTLSIGVAAYKPFYPAYPSILKIVFGGIAIVVALFLFAFIAEKRFSPTRPKSRKVALILAIIPHTGFLGIDRFYLGYYTIGLVKFFTSGGLLILYIIDIYRIAKRKMPDRRGNPLR